MLHLFIMNHNSSSGMDDQEVGMAHKVIPPENFPDDDEAVLVR